MLENKIVFIIGISSFLGSSLAESLKEKYRIIGTYFENEVHFQDVLSFKLDIRDSKKLEKFIEFFKPDIVIYAIGVHSLTESLKDKKRTELLNLEGVMTASDIAERNFSKFIYLSSHYVFDGNSKSYTENSEPHPLTLLGSYFAASEFFIKRSSHNYLILRLPIVFGSSHSSVKLSITEKLEYLWHKDSEIILDNDIEYSFLSTLDLSGIIQNLIYDNELNETYNLALKDSLSIYEFAKLYFSILKIDKEITSKHYDFPLHPSFSLEPLSLKLSFKLESDKIKESDIKQSLKNYFKVENKMKLKLI